MDRWCTFLIVLLGFASCRHDEISRSVSEVTVTPGDNITLYCDCKVSSGVFIVWFRNCSHENQPTLVLPTKLDSSISSRKQNDPLRPLPRFEFLCNKASNSYDLLIMNVSDADEGLYYCGTEQTKVEENKYIALKYIRSYGNTTTRLKCDSRGSISNSVPGASWVMMVFAPALTILSSFLSFILVYHFCQKTVEEPEVHHKTPNTRGQTRCAFQDDDVCLTQVVFRHVKAEQTHL